MGPSGASSPNTRRATLAVCVTIALAAHVSALAWARARPDRHRRMFISAAEVSVEEERREAVAPPPMDPPPAAQKPAPPPLPVHARAQFPPSPEPAEPPAKDA